MSLPVFTESSQTKCEAPASGNMTLNYTLSDTLYKLNNSHVRSIFAWSDLPTHFCFSVGTAQREMPTVPNYEEGTKA